MIIELKKEKLLNYGEIHFLEFIYTNSYEHKKIYELFNNNLMQLYGPETEYIIPNQDNKILFFSINNNQLYNKNNNQIGVCVIPEKLLPIFIKRLVEFDKIKIRIGKKILKDIVNYNDLKQLLKTLNLNIELKKGPYFDKGNCIYAKFNYKNNYQQDKIFALFEQELLPLYGPNSKRAQEKQDFIQPYFLDNQNNVTTKPTNIIGGVNIPKDISTDLIKIFINIKNTEIKIGDKIIDEAYFKKNKESKIKMKSM